jgi:hypothetical protein
MTRRPWLLLTDYAVKYRISVSTLRRRIRSSQVPYRFELGKYFLPDEPPHSLSHDVEIRATAEIGAAGGSGGTAVPEATHQEMEKATQVAHGQLTDLAIERGPGEPLIESATRVVTDLKRTYSAILQDKETQIAHLRDEVADLKTLVQLLERENERLSTLVRESGMNPVQSSSLSGR